VRAWRRLKALGAVALKSGAYLLPDSPDRYEQFQWLAQEVEKDRGEATLLKVDRVENMKQPEVVRLFQEARDADYADLTDRYRKLGASKGPRVAGELARLAREMDRLHRSCRRLIWLNPLLRYAGFEPKSLGMRAMLPHVDEFRPVHDLASLETLIGVLSARVAGRGGTDRGWGPNERRAA